MHDLDPEMVFDGCASDDEETLGSKDVDEDDDVGYELELVLKTWYALDQSRELRCFVRDEVLLGTVFVMMIWQGRRIKRKTDEKANGTG